MKSLSALFFLATSLFIQQANAIWVSVQNNIALEPVCAITTNVDIYGTLDYQLKDAFYADGEFIISNLSTLTINTLGNKAIIDSNFFQPSNYTPATGAYTVAWQNGKTKLNLPSLVPADRDTTIAQVVYKIRRVPVGPWVTPAVNLISVPDLWPSVFPGAAISYGINTKSFNPSAAVVDNECQNIRPRWCWDGVIDSGYWEVCDNGTANGTPGNSCNISCSRAPFDLSIKKYVNSASLSNDAQTAASAVTIASGTPYTYIFRVTNNGTAPTSSTTAVSDVSLPTGISLTSIPSGSGWTCGFATGWFTCSRSDVLAAGDSYPDITANVIHTGALPVWALQNTATVINPNENPANNFGNNNSDPANVIITPPILACTPGTTVGSQRVAPTSTSAWLCPTGAAVSNFTGIQNPSTGIFSYTWACNASSVGGACSAQFNPNSITSFDLSLKKYVNSIAQDAQDGSPVSINPTTAFTYLIQVTNTATSANAVTGTTTVTDPGPAAGVNLIGTPSGTGWTCTRVGAGFSCTTTATPAIGANFPDISASATTTAATGTFRNLATVANPGDTTLTNNTDPANVQVGTGGGGGGGPGSCESLTAVQVSGTNTVGYAMQCTPSIAAGGSPTIEIRCGNGQIINGATGTCLFNSSTGSPYQAECYVNNSTSGGPNTGCRRQLDVTSGAPLPPGVYCGNGIIDQGLRTLIVPAPLGAGWTCNANMNPAAPTTIRDYTCTSTLSEQCDAGNVGGVNISNALCNAVCQTTLCVPGTPGCATSTNPSSNPLSILFDPSAPGRTTQSVSATRWIIGNGVPVFDAGDQFLLSSPFPTILRGATMAISNSSALIDGISANKTFGPECIGAGSIDFGAGPQPCNNNTPVFTAGAGGVINGVTFKGNASTIAAAGASADVNPPLSAGSAILQSNFAISLGYLVEPIPVRVSKPAVSTTAGGGAFVAAARPVGFDVNTITSGFLNDLQRGNFTISAGTNTNSATLGGSNSSVGLSPSGVVTPSSVVTITTAADINHTNFAKVGDAPNIYLIANGVVKLGSPTTPLILSGIGTIVIEKGTLEILGDIQYADANSSWAFIIKEPAADGVAIRIAPGVERIAGAYLALSGKATGTSSTTPLAIDGNMNADIGELVTSRTYIRGVENSTALSTGVTINYSTRALKNPPPLLTQYLEQYNLDRVSR